MKITSLSEIGIRALNEDAIFIDENRGLFAVFDGASSLDNYKNERGETGGYIASHSAVETFSNSSANNAASLFEEANHEIELLHKAAGIDTADPIHRFGTTVAAAYVHKHTIELLQCADSVAIVIDKAGRATVPLGYHDQDLPEMLEWKRLAEKGMKGDEIHQLIRPRTIEKRRQVNETFGTMNGDTRAQEFAFTSSIARTGIAHIILLTDGMFVPKEDPEAEEDWQQYADIFLQGGIRELFSIVRKIESSDPNLTRYPRYKLHDDASAVAITL